MSFILASVLDASDCFIDNDWIVSDDRALKTIRGGSSSSLDSIDGTKI